MRNALKSCSLFALGALALLAALECVFRLLPTYSGLQPNAAPRIDGRRRRAAAADVAYRLSKFPAAPVAALNVALIDR